MRAGVTCLNANSMHPLKEKDRADAQSCRQTQTHHRITVTKGAEMYVVQHSEASVRAIGSTGTKIATVRAPSGKVVQLINIRKEEARKIDTFISCM